jgi:deoxyribodipyrimidine photo-lyase
VFNPTLQQEKFDPKGEYLQKWIPELKTGKYPPPMLDHAKAKEIALAAWEKIR